MSLADLGGQPDVPSPTNLRELLAKLRAHSALVAEAHRLGLGAVEAAELICELRTFPGPVGGQPTGASHTNREDHPC